MENKITIIDSAELATVSRLTDEIKSNLTSAQQSLIQACIKLAEVRAKKLYKAINCRNFEEYCEREIGIVARQGFKYATIGEFIKSGSRLPLFEESFQQLGVEKLYLISRTDEAVREEVAKAVDLNNTTVKDLKAKIAELEQQNKRLSDKIDHRFDDLENKITESVKLEKEQVTVPDERPVHPEKQSFILYCDYVHDITKLSMEERGELFTAIMCYTNDLPIPSLEKSVDILFGHIKRQIDRDYDKWLDIKQKRTEAVNKRWEKEKQNDKDEYNCNFCNTNDTVNVNVNDNVIVNDTEDVTESLEQPTSKSKRKKFVPPTLEEVMEYCQERQNNVNAEKFVDFYTSNGWKVGKNSMKDWKATVRNWEKNEWNQSKQIPQKQEFDPSDPINFGINRF